MKNFIIDYRPSQFKGVWGNQRIKGVVESWAKKDRFSNSIIIIGDYGTGKTTLSRLIARKIICSTARNSIEACGECAECLSPHLHIEEFDATRRSVDEIKRYINRYAINLFTNRPVLYFDEIQRWYMKNQEIFLKPIEEIENICFIFSTTSLGNIDPGIVSRSIILNVQTPSVEEMCEGLSLIAKENSIDITDGALMKLIRILKNNPRKCLNAFNILIDVDVRIDEQTLEDDFIRKAVLQR